MLSLLVENMPWLENVGFVIHGLHSNWIIPVHLKGVFQLTRLSVQGTLPLQASFPELRFAQFYGPMTDPKCLEAFAACSKLKSLIILRTPHSQMVEIFKAIGRGLTQLEFSELPDEVDIAEIFYHCPNLESIDVGFCSFIDYSIYWHQISVHQNAQSLRHCRIARANSIQLLEFVFNAPGMMKIECESVELGHREVLMLQNLEASALQNLEVIKFGTIIRGDEVVSRNDYVRMFKSIITKAPKLRRVDYHFNVDDDGNAVWDEQNPPKDVHYFFDLMNHLMSHEYSYL
jgi:hypothetical protein